MDKLDGSLLNIVQTCFPIADRPYRTLASLTGTTEKEAWQRIQSLRIEGIIRRLGGVFDSRRLGYQSTLCAAKVPEDKIQILADSLLNIPGVTHNYFRNHAYNIWFTLIAPSQKEVDRTLTRIKEIIGSEEVYSLPAERVFKVNVNLNFNSQDKITQSKSGEGSLREVQGKPLLSNHSVLKLTHYPVDEEDIILIRQLQQNIPDSLTPYAEIANKLTWDEKEVLLRIQNLINSRVIRRFGAVLRHQQAGFIANVMGVWKVPEAKVEQIGIIMASFREVSHCYQRPTLIDWPYNLFTMIHARSHEECAAIVAKLSQTTGINQYSMLFSIMELKKSSMQYFMEDTSEKVY